MIIIKTNLELNDEYAKELLQILKDIEIALKYYIDRTNELENEVKVYKEIYEHRVDEQLKNREE